MTSMYTILEVYTVQDLSIKSYMLRYLNNILDDVYHHFKVFISQVESGS